MMTDLETRNELVELVRKTPTITGEQAALELLEERILTEWETWKQLPELVRKNPKITGEQAAFELGAVNRDPKGGRVGKPRRSWIQHRLKLAKAFVYAEKFNIGSNHPIMIAVERWASYCRGDRPKARGLISSTIAEVGKAITQDGGPARCALGTASNLEECLARLAGR